MEKSGQANCGFREIAHTADWELEVWAGDLAGLFEQAARGMYSLTNTSLAHEPRFTRRISLSAGDREGTLGRVPLRTTLHQ